MESEEENVINIRDFLEQRLALIREDYFLRHKNVREAIRSDLNLPEAAFDRLEEMCNPRLLNSDELQAEIKDVDELHMATSDEAAAAAAEAEAAGNNEFHLASVEFMRTLAKSPKRNYPVEIKFMKNMAKLNDLEPASVDDLIDTPDVVLVVQVSNPLLSKYKKLSCSEEFAVLGQTGLCELKDRICCFRDEIKVGEFSEDPDSIRNAPVLKDIIKSGYFLIENTIYSDLRGENVDCSEPVLKWANQMGLNFEAKSMESAKFIELGRIRLGYPYLYNHLGNCQHLIVFTSIKLVNPSTDCYCKSKYPIVRDKLRGRFTFCWCCNNLYAKWIVSSSIFSVDDPTFLCERCLRNTHYLNKEDDVDEANQQPSTSSSSSSGLKKACDFKAFHYSQI